MQKLFLVQKYLNFYFKKNFFFIKKDDLLQVLSKYLLQALFFIGTEMDTES